MYIMNIVKLLFFCFIVRLFCNSLLNGCNVFCWFSICTAEVLVKMVKKNLAEVLDDPHKADIS